MNSENSMQEFFEKNNIEPSVMRTELLDMFDGYMQNESQLGNFNFDNISRKFYIIKLLNELIDGKVETQIK